MKKSVILILIAVYVLSIGVVGFLGLNVRFYDPNVPPTGIEITLVTYLDEVVDIKINEDGTKYIPPIYCEDDKLSINLRYTVTPDNATDKSVSYSFDPGNYVSEQNGVIVFERPDDWKKGNDKVAVEITVRLKDNNTVYDKIIVSVRFI